MSKVPVSDIIQIDSAKYYENEAECADAMRKSGIDRSQIFYTSKIPVNHMKNYETAKSALEASFAAAKLDYIDLYATSRSGRKKKKKKKDPRYSR